MTKHEKHNEISMKPTIEEKLKIQNLIIQNTCENTLPLPIYYINYESKIL